MIPESAIRHMILPRKVAGEVIGETAVFFDEGDNVVGVQPLDEISGDAAKAMFAKQFGKDKRAMKARSGTKAKQKKGGTNDYYRKRRKGYAKKYGLNQNAAIKNDRKVPKGKRKRKKGKSKGESLARVANATATLLTSPYQEDVLAATRLVMERGADWPAEVQHYVGEALVRAHSNIENTGLAQIVENACEHLRAPLHEEHEEHDGDEQPEFEFAPEPEADDHDHADAGYVDDATTESLRAMEAENARLTELVGALTDLNNAQAVESKVDVLCLKHPALEKVRAKLVTCENVETVVEEADTYLAFIGESASPVTEGNATGLGTVRVPSQGNNGAVPLQSGRLEEGMVPMLKTGRKTASSSTSSRVANYRRRQRNQQG